MDSSMAAVLTGTSSSAGRRFSEGTSLSIGLAVVVVVGLLLRPGRLLIASVELTGSST